MQQAIMKSNRSTLTQTPKRVDLDLYTAKDSVYGPKTEAELWKLSKELKSKGYELCIHIKDANTISNKKFMENVVKKEFKKKYNPNYPIVVPVIVRNNKPIYIGYSPKLKEIIAKLILNE